MKSTNKHVINVLATGFVTLTIMSIALFWCRELCRGVFYKNLRESTAAKIGQVKIRPIGLMPQLDNDPNVYVQSSIKAYIGDGMASGSLGIVRDFRELENGKSSKFCVIRRDKKKGNYDLILFDKNSGLFVFYDVFKVRRGWARKVKLYAGPKGISKTADKNLGRFSKPHKNLWAGFVDSFTFFDKSLSSFFQIRFPEEAVVKGPGLAEEFRPVQMELFSGLGKNMYDGKLCLYLEPPLRKATEQDKEKKEIIRSIKDEQGREIDLVKYDEKLKGAYLLGRKYYLVLDESGQVRKLNKETLELSSSVGYLPSAPPWPNRLSCAKPDELFAFHAWPVIVEQAYTGTIAASISREGLGLRIAIFDPNGNLIEQKGSFVNPLKIPGGPVLVIIEYILENLQSPVLGLASYFTASSFEATAGYRAIFILPNSFVAMFGRDTTGIIGPIPGVLFIISPSILLGAFLAWRIRIDAGTVGLSGRAKYYWTIGAILFGLSAYITYRLTRPKITLVTCTNCGKLRRPDMDVCHCCGSRWLVPELIPPTWRVIDS